MLVIRKEQMAVMSEYMFDNFISDMVVHLRNDYPREIESMDDDSLRVFIRESIERANSFNIRASENLEFFLDCEVVYGPAFYTHQDYVWAKVILLDEKNDETEKMSQINEYQIFAED